MLGGCAGEVGETDLDLEDTGLEFYMYRLVFVSSSPWAWIFSSENGICQMSCKELVVPLEDGLVNRYGWKFLNLWVFPYSVNERQVSLGKRGEKTGSCWSRTQMSARGGTPVSLACIFRATS